MLARRRVFTTFTMDFRDTLKSLRNIATRSARPAGPFDPLRAEPVSRKFGMDRGTPIDRRYIEAFLQQHAHHIRGTVLEVADSKYTRQFGGERVTSSEVLHATPGNSRATVVADLSQPESLPTDFADCFVCTQTLNFIYDFHGAIRGIHRVLRPGGTVLCHGLRREPDQPVRHEAIGDFWRFTTASAKRSFEDVFGPGVRVYAFGNLLAAAALFQGLAVEDLPNPDLLDHSDPDYELVIAVAAGKRLAQTDEPDKFGQPCA